MKDRQVENDDQLGQIPILSPVLHCIAMTVIVYLRSSFGFAYLRPKSIFFALSWAWLLFTLYAWHEPGVWRFAWLACLFGLGSIGLYAAHLATAFSRAIYRTGAHDRDSGKSHLGRLKFLSPQLATELNLHLWVEPALVAVIGLLLHFFGERYVSNWLVFVAVCLAAKEAINYWFELRREKRQGDVFADAEDDLADEGKAPSTPESSTASRKSRAKRPRPSTLSPEEDLTLRKYAEILSLQAPYTLEQAERNYKATIKITHPDRVGNEEATAATAALNEAIRYFRDRRLR